MSFSDEFEVTVTIRPKGRNTYRSGGRNYRYRGNSHYTDISVLPDGTEVHDPHKWMPPQRQAELEKRYTGPQWRQ